MSHESRVVAVLALIISTGGLRIAHEARQSPQISDTHAAIVGDWRGESVCVVRDSACHDENSLYHVALVPGKPNVVSLKADKIVDGKPVTMGTGECSHHSLKHTLTCELPKSVMRLTIRGDKMEGTMTLADGTLWRRISLKKSAP
jgi:hypothetical protein